jgi:pilus assembly protein CpaE
MPQVDISALACNWKALLICPDRDITGELTPLLDACLPRMQVFEMQSYPARQVLAEMSGPQGPNICFLDVCSDRERGLQVLAELAGLTDAMKVIVLAPEKDPDLILRAMRYGAVEFLVQPFSGYQLETAVERLAGILASGGAEQGRVYAVMPAKGACGASTLAANLAPQLKRAGKKKILLADFDALTGTLAFLLKLKSNYSFMDALSRATTLDTDIWKGIVTTAGAVDALLAPDAVVEGLHDLRDSTAVLEFARGVYEAVIVDSCGVYGSWNLAIAKFCDDLLLVTTNELAAVQATQRALVYLEQNRVNRSKVRLIVNRYHKEHGLSREVIETALHVDVYHLIPSDYDSVQKALIEGKPIPLNSAYGKSLTQLVERLSGKEETAPAPKRGSAFSTLKALFSKG